MGLPTTVVAVLDRVAAAASLLANPTTPPAHQQSSPASAMPPHRMSRWVRDGSTRRATSTTDCQVGASSSGPPSPPCCMGVRGRWQLGLVAGPAGRWTCSVSASPAGDGRCSGPAQQPPGATSRKMGA